MIFNLSGGGSGEGVIIVYAPTVTVGTYTYDGTPQGPTIGEYDSSKIIVRNATATDAGTYTLTLSLRNTNKMVWSDLTTADKTYSYTIGKMPLSVPTVTGSFTYDTTQKSATIGQYDTTYITQGGTTSATNYGTYTVTFDLNDTANTMWSDTTTSQKTKTWNIAKRSITVPSVSGSYTYNGSVKNAVVTGLDTDYVTQGGTASATNAGTYTVTFNLNDTTNTEWSGGGTGQKTGTWTIAQATGALSLSKSSVTLGTNTPSDTITVTVTGDGTVTAQSSDTTVATVTKNGNVFTIATVNNKTGTATITFTLSATTNYTGASATASVTAQFVSIYGVEWDGTSTTAWSRTDDAAGFVDPVPAVNNGTGSSPFDGKMPWSGMVKSERTGGTMVAIPKFWYKWTITGGAHKLQIADAAQTGFSVSPAHMDRGDGKGERDVVYVGRYHCASDYKSKTGVKPVANITRATARSSIHSLGSTIWQFDYAMLLTIQMLYLVEFANWNSQAKIGYGCGNNSSTENMGATDAMQYHTGTNAANRTTYGHVQYRYIEDLWGNVFDWCDGIYFSNTTIYAIKNPANYSDTSGGTNVGTRPSTSGCITQYAFSSASGYTWFRYPSAVSGTDYSIYASDRCSYSSSGVVLCVGGGYSQGQNYGLFYLVGYYAASDSGAGIGSRLQELPSAA